MGGEYLSKEAIDTIDDVETVCVKNDREWKIMDSGVS